jgi:hypothetical protein
MAGKRKKKASPKGPVFQGGSDVSYDFGELLESFAEFAFALPKTIDIHGRRKPTKAEEACREADRLVMEAIHLDPDDVPRQSSDEQAAAHRLVAQRKRAHAAIAISADCAAAHALLGDLAMDGGEGAAEGHYRDGIAAGERLLGTAVITKYAGQMSRIPEASGYLMCRHGLVQYLMTTGRLDDAIAECQTLLRDDDEDPTVAQCILLDLLVSRSRFDEARLLCETFHSDVSATWAYSRVLVAFADAGDTPDTRGHFANAIRMNPFIPGMLLSMEPREPEPFDEEPGSEGEAMAYAHLSRRSWLDVPGAISWLREMTNMPLLSETPTKKAPRSGEIHLLASFPQDVDETWEVDLFRDRANAWAFYVVSGTDGRVLTVDVSETRPGVNRLWGLLADAMRRPSSGDPRRPGTVAMRLGVLPKAWNKRFAQLGIAQQWCDSLSMIEATMDHVDLHMDAADEARHAETDPDSDARAHSAELAALPHDTDEVWEAAVGLAPSWVTGEGKPYRPWFAVVASQTRNQAILPDVRTEPPGPATLMRLVQAAIRETGHRPGCIEVSDADTAAALANGLEPTGIEIRVSKCGMPTINRLVAYLAESMAGPVSIRPLTCVPGMSEDIQRAMYAAAASYYRARPWRTAPGDSVIDIRDGDEGRLVHVVVMGQSGVQQGLAIYEDAVSLDAARSGDHKAAASGTSLALMYGEPFEIHAVDFDMIEQQGFEVSGPEAWPLVVRANPGGTLRAPLAWEVELLTTCLRAVPAFLKAVPFPRRGGRGGIGSPTWTAPSGQHVSWH